MTKKSIRDLLGAAHVDAHRAHSLAFLVGDAFTHENYPLTNEDYRAAIGLLATDLETVNRRLVKRLRALEAAVADGREAGALHRD